ncbi:PIN domain-containing protein [Luteolibacter sp. SL250]|uniref:TA system VapC family ribonuclease toxin n=1 Tax=Luteolibacter sp. SL250 TaxID=2995170 RepID=UPI00226FF809|nr:TA system VapC family ribonuclease toxin [Luteolibacter sp. SL250]WAC20382.1 PIN domain-containing protein [Luteolibacter sp. SL250]
MLMVSTIDLPDVNVWLALADSDHAFHRPARAYWGGLRPEGLAFCRVTMMGFLRLVTHPKVMAGRPYTRTEAWEIYRTFRALPEVTFLKEPDDVEIHFESLEFSQRLWTDAYLAAFALSGNHRIVSFDADFQQFSGLELLLLEQ